MGSALLVVHLWSCIMQEPQHLTRLLLSSLTFKYNEFYVIYTYPTFVAIKTHQHEPQIFDGKHRQTATQN